MSNNKIKKLFKHTTTKWSDHYRYKYYKKFYIHKNSFYKYSLALHYSVCNSNNGIYSGSHMYSEEIICYKIKNDLAYIKLDEYESIIIERNNFLFGNIPVKISTSIKTYIAEDIFNN